MVVAVGWVFCVCVFFGFCIVTYLFIYFLGGPHDIERIYALLEA